MFVVMMGCKAMWGGCGCSLQGLWVPGTDCSTGCQDEQSLSSSVFVTRGH